MQFLMSSISFTISRYHSRKQFITNDFVIIGFPQTTNVMILKNLISLPSPVRDVNFCDVNLDYCPDSTVYYTGKETGRVMPSKFLINHYFSGCRSQWLPETQWALQTHQTTQQLLTKTSNRLIFSTSIDGMREIHQCLWPCNFQVCELTIINVTNMGHIFWTNTLSNSYLIACILHYSHYLTAFLTFFFINTRNRYISKFDDSKAELLNIWFLPNKPPFLVSNVS